MPPTPDRLRRVRTVVEPAGTVLWRGHRTGRAAGTLTPPVGATRFAPLPDTRHAYLSASRTGALLESCLHDLHVPDPVIYGARLDGWRLTPVRLTGDVRLADLRNPELERLAIDRGALVHTSAAHYPCTRRWADALHTRTFAGAPIDGIVWHSRQADLHAAALAGRLAADLLAHRTVEVMVLWSPPAPARVLRSAGPTTPLMDDGRPTTLVHELAALLGSPLL